MINVSTKYIKMLESALSIELITRIKTDRGKILESITNEEWDKY